MKNTNWVVGQLQRKYRFEGYTINCREERKESVTEYYDATFKGKEIELKVTYDKKGHWTEFEIEKREGDSEDWYFFDSFEAHIA